VYNVCWNFKSSRFDLQARALNKRCLALGGAKNHLIAAPDCNLDMTAQDIVNSFTGCTGQRCMAASVLLTIGERQDLLDLIVKKASLLKPGSDKDQMGPVIDIMSKEKILKYIDEAETKHGAKILLDGRGWAKKEQGFWVGPTVILCKSPKDPAMTEEIFGPVVSVYACKTGDEAIQIENSSPYGNAACIYTESGKTAELFLERFGAAMLGCNIGVPVPREPFSFGGTKQSKFGDFDITGDGAIELFTVRKKITTKWSKPKEQTWLN
jgi:malonate-semialdehyde dehydrogenase (acetylating) / methylmalonate-semialdehyde dehydrogenase